VTRGTDVPVALTKTVDAFGRLDYAFNNAGAEQQRNPIADITEENGTGSSRSISAACSCA
jgi:NAD(P)-dependent dehydrogenase (short-subunit alcohol dehydrogenase family)